MLKYRFGIKLDDYNQLLEKQNYKCGICKITLNSYKKTFCVDHDHKTKIIRGLLCTTCNQGLGYFQDNVDFLTNAIEYLCLQSRS